MLQRLIVARGVFFLVDLGAAVSGMRADCGLSGYCVLCIVPKNGPFWTKNGQTWQACQRSKVVQNGQL